MLTTTRREIVNDYEVSQERPVRNFVDYAYEEVAENRFEDKMEVRPVENYMSRSEIAQRLYGHEYNEFYEEDHNDENYSDPDLMPSMKTMQITRRVEPQQVQTKSATKQSYTAKSKILIASYAAVLLALALIFTLTIVSIGSLFATTSEVEVKANAQYKSAVADAPASAYVYEADSIFVK
ncbi:MAG: hypothetical protein IKA42_00180 [Clostridia bacterium]|nr:hypothetical protein [Clostridia bacterium]MBR2302201.1 hypothetical protein [Clostridia bacterium]